MLRVWKPGAIAAGLTLLIGCSSAPTHPDGASLPLRFELAGTNAPSGPAGATLRLDHRRGQSPGNMIGEFMYFVPLISPEPVTAVQSAGNTQRMRLVGVTRRFAADSFSVAGEFEITGEGSHRTTFDPAENARRNERKLKDGGSLERALNYISIEGAGWGRIEVEGIVSNRVATVTEVRLQFNARGHHSPVTIGLHDLRLVDGGIRADNAVVARVNTLTFQRAAGRPKMAVSLASVNREDAKDTLWQTLKGGFTGALANLFIKPISVERIGNDAILDFGRALAAAEPAFTFPSARNLRAKP